MTAALVRLPHHQEGLQKTRFVRDLGQIADLIEVCFASQMDRFGRAMIGEMKAMASLGPLLWLIELLDVTSSLGEGYVWRDEGRVVGNTSLYHAGPHPYLGRGYLVANVAVHPDYRQRGMAYALMAAAIDKIHRQGGNWISLQVEADNIAALGLYDKLGFERFEGLTHWEYEYFKPSRLPVQAEATHWTLHRRRLGDGPAEIDLIFSRARRGGMVWTRPITRYEVTGGIPGGIENFLEGQNRERWVLPNPPYPQELLGAVWIDLSGMRRAQINIFIDPALDDPIARQQVILHSLTRPPLEGRNLRLETATGDQAVEDLLRQIGFKPVRHLIQMRLNLSPAD